MDLLLSEEQKLIQSTAREVLQSECPPSLVRAMEDDARGYPPQLWRKMAELGWTGMAFPERYGGSGHGFLELCILIEEQGRVRLPAPFFSTVVLCGLPIARFGTETQKSQYLAAIARGERILAYVQAEPGHATWEASVVDLVATASDDGYVLDGTKIFVPYAHVADDLLVAARTSGSGEDGITLFLVDARAGGVTRERLETIGADHQHRITFESVRVPGCNVLGQVDEGLAPMRAIHEWGAAAKCAEMLGGAQRVLEMTVEYAKERVQFGQPIGAFQAVQHHCADMALDVESSRFTAYEAIWRLSEGLEASHEVSIAKAWVSDAYQHVCALGHQVHGAIGFTREHDMHLYFRHARASEVAFGDGDYHREVVARRLGL